MQISKFHSEENTDAKSVKFKQKNKITYNISF